MSWNRRVNSNYREERPSTPIYDLRKEGRLEEAYQLALRLYQQDSDDDDINKAFSWVLIDLCKKFISEQNLSNAQTYFNQLSSIQFEYEDEFVETIKKQIHFLKPKIDTNYSEIQKAEELSKKGNNKEALAIFKNLFSQNRLTEFHHESYGWIIYRYIKTEENNLTSVEVRTFLRDYMNLKNERPSMLHSMILNFALNYSKAHSDFKFCSFFLLWNPENLRSDDWKETKSEEQIFKPLALKAIKQAFEVLKIQTSEKQISWLIQLYEKAINLFPDNEWLLREKAILHYKNNEFELAIKIYKKLVMELADKYYVWQEFADCITSDNSLKVGMLSKAISLEKNEDFLGEIHLDLAKVLIAENLLENALVELVAYKKHRDKKGWKLSSIFEELHQKVRSINIKTTDNYILYKKYIPIAENFAYADIDWKELVLIDKWRNKNEMEYLSFTDGNEIEFSIHTNCFEIIESTEIGQIYKFKLYIREVVTERFLEFPWIGKEVVTEYISHALMASKSEKIQWEIFNDTYALIEYINIKKNIVHAITSDNNEVFFPQTKSDLRIGDFIKAKIFKKKGKNENRYELRLIEKIDKDKCLGKFHNKIAVVDSVNHQKKLFHYVINSELHGIVKFNETDIRPKEGDFIKLIFAWKTDKFKIIRIKIISIKMTNDLDQSLRKDICGTLEVMYKPKNFKVALPDFGLIEDVYVPKYLLEKFRIRTDCSVNARVVNCGDSWKAIDLKVIKSNLDIN